MIQSSNYVKHRSIKMKLSDIKKKLAEAGIVVQVVPMKVSGKSAYIVHNMFGLFTKSGLVKLLDRSL